MIKGIFRTYTQAGTILLPFFYHQFSGHGDIAYLAYFVPPQGYHTWGIMNMFQPNFVSKVGTLLDEDYCLYV